MGQWLGDGGHADPEAPESFAGTGPARVFRSGCVWIPLVGAPLTLASRFGEEYRPVRLSKFVYGYKRSKEQSEFQFMSSLNYRSVSASTPALDETDSSHPD